jgi:hypothetical protein
MIPGPGPKKLKKGFKPFRFETLFLWSFNFVKSYSDSETGVVTTAVNGVR